jgi:prophage antirepressor-like protein
MSPLTKFEFKGRSVRSVTKDGEPWFVAKDVCDTLGLTNSRQAVAALDDDEKNTVTLNDGIRRGNPNVAIVSEPGLYRLISRSDKPQAKAFLRWVTHEVLPAIRKTGSFGGRMPNSTELAMMVIARDKQLSIGADMMRVIEPDYSTYGATARNGKLKTGVRRAHFVASASRTHAAAALLTLAGQLNLELEDGK